MSAGRWVILVVVLVAVSVALRVASMRVLTARASIEAGVQRAIADHAARTRQGTASIRTALTAAGSALSQEHASVKQEQSFRRIAVLRAGQAELALAAADSAAGTQDSVRAYARAYRARTAEVEALLAAGYAGDTALQWANTRNVSLERAFRISEVRAVRADSVLAVVARAGESTRDCRLLWVVRCPGRVVTAAVAAAIAVVVVGGRLRAPPAR
jgi:hypothetical protein